MTTDKQDQLVLDTIARIEGGVTLHELAYQTGLPPHKLLGSLARLVHAGRARPWAWTTREHATTIAQDVAARAGITRASPGPHFANSPVAPEQRSDR